MATVGARPYAGGALAAYSRPDWKGNHSYEDHFDPGGGTGSRACCRVDCRQQQVLGVSGLGLLRQDANTILQRGCVQRTTNDAGDGGGGAALTRRDNMLLLLRVSTTRCPGHFGVSAAVALDAYATREGICDWEDLETKAPEMAEHLKGDGTVRNTKRSTKTSVSPVALP